MNHDSTEINRRTLERFQAAWVNGDLEELTSLVTDDVVFSGSIGPEPGQTFRGREQVSKGFELFLAADTGYCQTEAPVVIGDDAYAEWAWYRSATEKDSLVSCGIDHFSFRDGKISLKNAYRKCLSLQSHPMRPAPGSTTPVLNEYKPRFFRFCGVEVLGSLGTKIYKIGAERVPDDSLDYILIQTLKELAEEVSQTEAHHGLAYAIIHNGTAGTWLLFHWWAYGEINCQILMRRLADGQEFVRREDPYVNACVWESVIIEHERTAWISNMLQERPSRHKYLKDTLPDGQH
jgi:ketosteroid isomerase-like protein